MVDLFALFRLRDALCGAAICVYALQWGPELVVYTKDAGQMP